MMKRAKAAFVLLFTLLFALQGIGIPSANAEVISKLTVDYIFDGLGDALNYGVVAEEFYQKNHAETSVFVDKLHKNHTDAFLNTETTFQLGHASALYATVSAPDGESLRGMQFALFTAKGSELIMCEDTIVTVEDRTNVTSVSWKLPEDSPYLKETLYIRQVEKRGNGTYSIIDEGAENRADLTVNYGPSVSSAAPSSSYIGALDTTMWLGQNDALVFYNNVSYNPAVEFGPGARLVVWVTTDFWGNGYWQDVTDGRYPYVAYDWWGNPDYTADLFIQYTYIDNATNTSETRVTKYQSLSYEWNPTESKGYFYTGSGDSKQYMTLTSTTENNKAAKLIADALEFSKELGNLEGGVVLHDESKGTYGTYDPSILGNSTVTGPEDENGNIVSLYTVKAENGRFDQSAMSNSIGQGQIMIAPNEYVVFNIVCEAKDGTVRMDPGMMYIPEANKVEQAEWEQGVDSGAPDRVLFNFVYLDEETNTYKPFEGTVIPDNSNGGTLLVPAGHVNVCADPHHGAIIAEIAENDGRETHQRTMTKAAQTSWVRMLGDDDVETGAIKVVKVNGTTLEGIGGVEFGVYSDKACTTQVAKKGSNPEGEIVFENLAPGTYYVKELKAPPEYTLSDKVYTVEVHAGVTSLVGTKGYVENFKGRGTLEVVKVEEGNTSVRLAGAVFEIYSQKGPGAHFDEKKATLIGTYTTNASGKITLRLDAGEYWIKEVEAPFGYEIGLGTPTKVTVKKDETVRVNGDYVTNRKIPTGAISVLKVDEDDANVRLYGAEFTVYADEDCTDVLTTFTTDNNGAANVELPIGTYWVKETKAPNNYVISDKVYKVTIRENQTTALGDGGVVTNKYVTGKAKLLKIGLETDQWGNLQHDRREHLAGALFGAYTDENCTQKVAEAYTDRNGWAYFELKPGFYYFKEISAPIGYEPSDYVIAQAIQANDDITLWGDYYTIKWDSGDDRVAVYNVKAREVGSIELFKVYKENGENKQLNGAEFKLYRDEACTTPVSAQTYVTATMGNHIGRILIEDLVPGTYYIREEKAPDGYMLPNPNNPIRVVVTANNTTRVNGDLDSNDPSYRVVVNQKATYGGLEIEKTDNSNPPAPLQGVVFTVYSDEACTKSVRVLTTGADGKASIAVTELPVGTYYVKETQGLDGYVADTTTVYEVDVVADSIAKVNGGTIVNEVEKKYGGLELTKTDESGNALANVEFTVYSDEACTKSVKVLTTDADGKASIAVTELPVGTYYVKETGALDGYVPNTTEYKVDVVADTITKVNGGTIINKKYESVDASFGFNKVVKAYGAPELKDSFTVKVVPLDGAPALTSADKVVVNLDETGRDSSYWREEYPYADCFKVTFTKAGVYTYEMYEEAASPIPGAEYHSDRIRCTFTVVEDVATGKLTYTSEFAVYDADGQFVGGTNEAELYNDYTLRQVSVKKEWDDQNNVHQLRPASIQVQLYANGGEESSPVELNEANQWSYVWSYLPEYGTDGTEIEYTVKEVGTVPGYDVVVQGDMVGGFTLVNQLQKGGLELTKTDESGNPLAGVEFTVYSDAACSTVEKVLTTGADGKASIAVTELPVGTYYVVETGALTGYTADTTVYEVEVTDGKLAQVKQGEPIINYKEKTDVSVTKVWSDGANADLTGQLKLYSQTAAGETLINSIPVYDEAAQTYTWSDLDKYDGAELITYIVREEKVEGYVTVYASDKGYAVSGETITNNKVEAIETEFTLNKFVRVWNSAELTDTVTFKVEALNGAPAPSRTEIKIAISETGRDESYWANSEAPYKEKVSFTFDKAGVYSYLISEAAGTNPACNYASAAYRVEYTVKLNESTGKLESALKVYEVSADGSEALLGVSDVIDFVNDYTFTKVSVEKRWVDNDNQDGIRPQSITVQLTADSVACGAPVKLEEANGWRYTWTGLTEQVKNENGEYTDIVYDIEEISVTGYTGKLTGDAETGFILTNTHETDKTAVSVEKRWEDKDNQDGIRPQSITVQLLADGENFGEPAELNEANGWKHVWSDLDKQAEGEAIIYTIEEIEVAGYTVELTGDAETGFILTNTHETEKTSVSVEKKWEDNENQDGIRPEGITVKLLADGVQKGDEVTLNEANGWKHVWSDLAKLAAGEPVVYTIEEIEVEGYTGEITGDAETGFILTNTHETEKTSVSVEKKWEDNENQDGIRPEGITVKLLADGVQKGDEVTLNEANGWKHVWSDLAKLAAGEPVVYTIEEIEVEGYTGEITGDAETGFVITNTHETTEVITTSVSVEKKWVDNNDQDGIRPAMIFVQLLANGEKQGEPVVLNADNSWKHIWTELEVGKTYEVEETAVEGYIGEITGDAETGFVITNTHETTEVITTSVSVEKKWVDNNDQDGIRPAMIFVQLLANGEKQGEPVVLNADNSWKHTWTELETGKTYTVEENAVEGYTGVITGDAETGFVITNTHETTEVITTSVSVEKKWVDNNDQDGIRPAMIFVQLLANGEKQGEPVVLNADNSWKYTWTELETGKTYTVEETAVEGYTGEITGDAETGFVITNTHETTEVITTSVSVEKKWVDNNDQDGIRPDSITVKLLADGVQQGEPVVLNADNSWKHTWTELEVGKTYTVEETAVEGYTGEITGSVETGFVITNTHETTEVITTSVSVEKKWVDNNDQDGIRPAMIFVQLLANGEKRGEPVVLNADNRWKHTWTELETGKTYTVEETAVEGYTGVITGDAETGFVITNTHETTEVITTSVSVEKKWVDNNDQDGIRPAMIFVQLLANGEKQGEPVVLNADNSWKYTWTELETGKTYTVEENAVEGYTGEITGDAETGFVITNTHETTEVITTSVSVEKKWVDNNDQDGIRPDSITVKLLADGVQQGEPVVLNADNSWKYTWTELETGKTYTVEETAVEGYTGEITGSAETGFIITNTHETTETVKISVSGTKIWADNNDILGKRPAEIIVNLLADGVKVDSAAVTGTGDVWSYEFTDLPKYQAEDQQKEIVYTVTEEPVEFYETTINGYDITNTCSYKASGSLVLKGEKNLTGNVLQVADKTFSFGVYVGDEKVAEGWNTEDGQIVFENIQYTLDDIGASYIYAVREIAGLSMDDEYSYGYDDTIYTVKVDITDGGDGELVISETYFVGSERADGIAFSNKVDYRVGSLGVKKVDSSDTTLGLAGAEFSVYSDESCRTFIGRITTGADGEGTLTGLNVGRYYVKETRAPEGYELKDTVYTVDVTADEVAMVNGGVVTNDKLVEGSLTLKKRVIGAAGVTESFSFGIVLTSASGDELAGSYDASINGVKTAPVVFTQTADGAKATVSLKDGETMVITGLAEGVTYTVTEQLNSRYSVQVNGKDTNTATGEISLNAASILDFQNTLKQIDFTVKKVWQGAEGGEIELILYANGVAMNPQPEVIRDGSTYTYKGLPTVDEKGEEIVYTVKETTMPGYVTIYQNTMPNADKTNAAYNGGTIINQEQTSFAVKKVWEGLEPGEEAPVIKLQLLCNGELYTDATPTPTADGWYVYNNLPATVNGVKAVYTVVEQSVEGFLTTYTNTGDNADEVDCAHNGGTIINSKIPQTGDEAHLALWTSMALLAIAGLLALNAAARKRENW